MHGLALASRAKTLTAEHPNIMADITDYWQTKQLPYALTVPAGVIARD